MNDRIFVITGATGATGKAAARAFAEHGASLVLIGTDQSKLDTLARDLKLPATRLLTLTADLRNADAVHSAAEAVTAKFGGVDGLIHLVGGWAGGTSMFAHGSRHPPVTHPAGLGCASRSSTTRPSCSAGTGSTWDSFDV